MGRKILAVVVSLIGATAVIMIVEMVNSFQFAPPSPEVMGDPQKLREFMAAGPAAAYGVALFGYALGAFVAGFVVTKMSRQVGGGFALSLFDGIILTALGVVNFLMLPGQPMWFMIAALIIFVPLSLLGNRLAR